MIWNGIASSVFPALLGGFSCFVETDLSSSLFLIDMGFMSCGSSRNYDTPGGDYMQHILSQ